MSWAIIAILVALWALGLIGGGGGSLIHALLVIAAIALLYKLLGGRRMMSLREREATPSRNRWTRLSERGKLRLLAGNQIINPSATSARACEMFAALLAQAPTS